MIRRSLAALGLAGLAACTPAEPVEPPRKLTSTNADTRSLRAAAFQFARDSAVAQVIADVCADEGLRLRGGSPRAQLFAFVRKMQALGYSDEQTRDAILRLDQDDGGRAAIRYLQARGVSPGDKDRLCLVGRSELAQGTSLGRLLAR
ncbi:hypothetical protein JQC91_07745 [Jannaschia sp. Os4]|uniref:DUF5333 family protein n=1 Tax=Jannaschia sp. Os4 TaxID=2807617 RepID=UPI0019395318|nr:DUF5333 family protein [Jannaschia sp. Os4]MBM2576195.1 hypothetical protein [Jannaschia sp. Os4]